MKRQLLLSILLLFAFTARVMAQAPQKINYQAVARNGQGNLLANQTISIRYSVRDGSLTGTVVFAETHSGVQTNQFGQFTAAIGAGTAVTNTFASIDWSTGSKFLQVEIDVNNGSTFTDMGTTELLSVPYAMYAASGVGAPGPTGPQGIQGIQGATGATGAAAPELGIYVYNNTVIQAFPSNSSTKVDLVSTFWEYKGPSVNSNIDLTANTFTAPVDGLYLVDFEINWQSGFNSIVTYDFMVNTGASRSFRMYSESTNYKHQMSGIVKLTTGQTLSVNVTQANGSSQSISSAALRVSKF